MKSFQHINASTVQEAADLLERHGDRGRPMAGGTDLLGALDRLPIALALNHVEADQPFLRLHVRPVGDLVSAGRRPHRARAVRLVEPCNCVKLAVRRSVCLQRTMSGERGPLFEVGNGLLERGRAVDEQRVGHAPST